MPESRQPPQGHARLRRAEPRDVRGHPTPPRRTSPGATRRAFCQPRGEGHGPVARPSGTRHGVRRTAGSRPTLLASARGQTGVGSGDGIAPGRFRGGIVIRRVARSAPQSLRRRGPAQWSPTGPSAIAVLTTERPERRTPPRGHDAGAGGRWVTGTARWGRAEGMERAQTARTRTKYTRSGPNTLMHTLTGSPN
jgi:hypothetical protein